MTELKLLDLFAGAGGCAVGYHRAGFTVTGVDIEPHDEYPFDLLIGDALDILADFAFLDRFWVVHASPPCQRYTTVASMATRQSHPDLIPPVREALKAWGGAYVIENVQNAPLMGAVTYCGSSFGLKVRRHRKFEANRPITARPCRHHAQRQCLGVYGKHPDSILGSGVRPNGYARGVKAASVAEAQEAMGIDWITTWGDLKDAIPPAYTEHLGRQLIEGLRHD